MPGRACVLSCFALLATVAALGCNIDNPGDEPPRGLLYFPNALALSQHASGEAPRYMLVANSDFDLRYKHGSLQALSLDRVKRAVDACRGDSECEIDPNDVLEDEVLISAFSTALSVSSDGRHVFSATRTDDSLGTTQLNADADGDDVLTCAGGDGCPTFAARGRDRESDKAEDLEWPADPVSIITGPLSSIADGVDDGAGDYVIVAHRQGQVSLFVPDGNELLLADAQQGSLSQLTGLAFDPLSRLVHFTVASQGVLKVLSRMGVVVPRAADGSADVQQAFLYDAGSVQLDGVAPFRDTRDLVFVPPLEDGSVEFSRQRALVLARDPSALLLVDVTPESVPTGDSETTALDVRPFHARVDRTVVVGLGASHVVTGSVAGRRLAVVSCFDSRQLFVIDLRTMLTRGVVPNLSGPFALELDEERQLVYVADFRSSVIRVIDLSPLSEGRGDQPIGIVATIGKPKVLQELQ
jgi:hypothetical protein